MGSQQEQDPDPTYFTCTLGEAQIFNSKTPHQYETINDFIEYHYHHNPDLPAFCFPEVLDKPPQDGDPSCGEFSFAFLILNWANRTDFDSPTPKALGKESAKANPVYSKPLGSVFRKKLIEQSFQGPHVRICRICQKTFVLPEASERPGR